MIDFFLAVLFSLIGSFIGIITGLLPGLHTNNIAILMIFISSIISNEFAIYLCILIISAAIAHTFLNIIPSTFIGAPDEDKALIALPAHSMVMEGRGYEAVEISAYSSLLSVIICMILLYPFKFILTSPLNLYYTIEKVVPWILICISILVIFTNKNFLSALLIFFISGLLGLAVWDMSSSFLIKSSPIFPALTGLFGLPALIYSYKTDIPEQLVESKKRDLSKRAICEGAVAGGIVSILPGISSAIATTIVMTIKKERSNEEVISILSATNTATSFFVIIALFIILKARSGFAIAIKELIYIERWEGIIFPYPLNLFMIAVIISAIFSYFATIYIGKKIAINISKISYKLILKISLLIIIVMVIISNGPVGLLILLTSSLIGILCLELRVRRSVCMGFLMIPVIISLL
ncbi:MAG: tripartite tricarboxylate transporter permease [Thermoplasmatales archaeon]|nr:tripartite tricarboxylate transporter permease [Thermoplasmatales archaeon]